tara:strand:+ start:88 stop:276 length:189 start_codon:yes stop_codon:yes gene_type:complete
VYANLRFLVSDFTSERENEPPSVCDTEARRAVVEDVAPETPLFPAAVAAFAIIIKELSYYAQ